MTTTRKTTTAATKATREILVILNGDKRRLVSNIPANAKITFGPVQPGGRGGYPSGDNALRIYTSEQNQLAVFVGVKEFRDLSLAVKEQKVIRKVNENSTKSSKGRSESVELEESVDWEDD